MHKAKREARFKHVYGWARWYLHREWCGIDGVLPQQRLTVQSYCAHTDMSVLLKQITIVCFKMHSNVLLIFSMGACL